MYEPQFWIEPKLYPYLIRWGLSMGYEVNTNHPHTLLYGLRCIDPIRIRELAENDAVASLNREEAVDLVESLEGIRTNRARPTGKGIDMFIEGVGPYDPPYHTSIRLDEDMYENHFRPDMEEAGYKLHAEYEGKFWHVLRVSRSDYDAANWKTDQGVMCRSDVTGMVRDMEFERRMSPYVVTYDVLKTGEGITKRWLNGLDTMEKAMAVLEREKPRYAPTADWRIYTDLTAIARQMKEEFPDDVVLSEGWLWLRIWHPGEYEADYWSESLFDNLADVRVAILEEEALDMYSVTAVYACVHHEARPEEPAAEPPPEWSHIASPTHDTVDLEEAANGGVALLWENGHWKAVNIYCTSDIDLVESPEFADFDGLPCAFGEKHDRLMLFRFYKALKIEDGITYERFAESGEASYERLTNSRKRQGADK